LIPQQSHQKYVATQIRQEPEALVRYGKNQTVRFGKSDGLILLISTAVRALSTLNEEASPPAKQRLDGR
jgi:hypothetical protein